MGRYKTEKKCPIEVRFEPTAAMVDKLVNLDSGGLDHSTNRWHSPDHVPCDNSHTNCSNFALP